MCERSAVAHDVQCGGNVSGHRVDCLESPRGILSKSRASKSCYQGLNPKLAQYT